MLLAIRCGEKSMNINEKFLNAITVDFSCETGGVYAGICFRALIPMQLVLSK